jgi:hypothetical protein
VFAAVFLVEMILKMAGLGVRMYFRDKFNSFDCFIVFTSTLDFIVSQTMSSSGSGGGAISALRAFRLMRVFKLAKSWKKLQELLDTIAATLKDISIFSVLLFLLMFTYSLLGMELFGNKVKFDSDGNIDSKNGTSPDSNFDYFLEAFASVFIVLANDGWSTIYFNHARVMGPALCSLYFLSLLIIG